MSLTDIVALPAEERKPNIKVDLSSFLGEDKYVEFREPRLGDLYPDTALVERLRISFPLISAEQISAAVILGKCYVKKPDEQSMDAIRTMCQILDNNPKIYLRMARQFNEEFMSVYNEIVASEGNVSTE
jgi:hypothetical protein